MGFSGMRPIFALMSLFIGVSLSVCPALRADPLATTRPSNLALEVEALRALDDLQAIPSQLVQLGDASDDPSADASAQRNDVAQLADLEEINRAVVDHNVCYVALLRLRQALLKADPRTTEQSEKEISDWEEKLQISFAPRIAPTPAAQRSVAAVMAQFSGRQIASYMARRGEEISDPTEILLGALSQCRGMEPQYFQPFSHDVSQQVAELVVGMGRPSMQRSVATRTVKLLKKAHGLPLDAPDSDLEDQARDIAKVDAPTALHHWMECEIAQLLSNPQLSTALTDRSLWAGKAISDSPNEQ
jgi:hypothetical protein